MGSYGGGGGGAVDGGRGERCGERERINLYSGITICPKLKYPHNIDYEIVTKLLYSIIIITTCTYLI